MFPRHIEAKICVCEYKSGGLMSQIWKFDEQTFIQLKEYNGNKNVCNISIYRYSVRTPTVCFSFIHLRKKDNRIKEMQNNKLVR